MERIACRLRFCAGTDGAPTDSHHATKAWYWQGLHTNADLATQLAMGFTPRSQSRSRGTATRFFGVAGVRGTGCDAQPGALSGNTWSDGCGLVRLVEVSRVETLGALSDGSLEPIAFGRPTAR